MAKGQKVSKEEFILRCNKIHDSKYNYFFVEFNKVKDKIEIICPIHGKFYQSAVDHMNGSECQKCSKEKGKKKQIKPLKEIIEQSIKKYNDRFEFDECSYRSLYEKMKIKCSKHG